MESQAHRHDSLAPGGSPARRNARVRRKCPGRRSVASRRWKEFYHADRSIGPEFGLSHGDPFRRRALEWSRTAVEARPRAGNAVRNEARLPGRPFGPATAEILDGR